MFSHSAKHTRRMASKACHSTDDANIIRFLTDAHFKDAVLIPRQVSQGFETFQAGLCRHDGRLLRGTQRRQRSLLGASQTQLHRMKIVAGPRDPFECNGNAYIKIGRLFYAWRQQGSRKFTVHRSGDIA